jgi:hypothetical protein
LTSALFNALAALACERPCFLSAWLVPPHIVRTWRSALREIALARIDDAQIGDGAAAGDRFGVRVGKVGA